MNTISIRVEGADQAGEARRRASTLGAAAGLAETAGGRLAIVVTELANNIWRHAGCGEILVTDCGDQCVEVLALDKGPGMTDPARCFQDGYSTAGSSGTGLGAVARLSDFHDLYTAAGKGSAILARIGSRSATERSSGVRLGGISVPMRGEQVCGDAHAIRGGNAAYVLAVDGLGHGPGAADCADAAVAAFSEATLEGTADLLREIHGALRSTRGAAVSIARIDYHRRQVLYSGVGNIAGAIWDGASSRHLLSHPGIVGHDSRNVRELTYDLPPDALVLLYSDGIATHWSLASYEGLLLRDPALIAGVIYRDQSRGRDDATVVVVRSC
jgi:anti-sigma regulatory factor (Ser/Thr protein kinase)